MKHAKINATKDKNNMNRYASLEPKIEDNFAS
ncbi:hypothetical protein protein [Bacillus cereus G9241]|nr:hypothetical protein protein [Bacillus cereus G9241]